MVKDVKFPKCWRYLIFLGLKVRDSNKRSMHESAN